MPHIGRANGHGRPPCRHSRLKQPLKSQLLLLPQNVCTSAHERARVARGNAKESCMQVPAPFEYERATSVDHAVGLLGRLGESARLVAGGHSLLPMMKLRLTDLEYLVDINDLHADLGYVQVEDSWVRIGAMTRHRELLESAELARV